MRSVGLALGDAGGINHQPIAMRSVGVALGDAGGD